MLFLWLWAGGAPPVDGCPAECSCFTEPRLTMACQQRGLEAIPTDIPTHVQRIFLQINRLTVVPSTAFSRSRNLTVLWLYSNRIRHIEAGAFLGLDRLEELDLGDNMELRSINAMAFSGLSRLRTLHLHRCGLLELPYGVFAGLSSLKYLHLPNNQLVAVPDHAFQDLANLAVLHLHNNHLEVLTEGMLRGLLSLDSLLLHKNRVAAVHPQTFRDLRRLSTLFLFDNNLTALSGSTMQPLQSLSYLRLNGNQWICDCRARPLWTWFRSFKGSSSVLECHMPERLRGRDLKMLNSTELDGCYDSHTGHRLYGKLHDTESPLGAAIPNCCLANTDKSSILADKGSSDRSSYNSQQITKNPLKEKENISKTKGMDTGLLKNGTRTNVSGESSGAKNYPSGKHRRDFAEDQKKCSQNLTPDGQCLLDSGSILIFPDFMLLSVVCVSWSL